MRISGFTTVRPNMPTTRTYDDFMKFLGANPARLGIVSSLYDEYTATNLTEALLNTYSDGKAKKGYQSLNSFVVEWDLNINRIKRLQMVAEPIGDGKYASDIQFFFGENYYQKNDVFVVERSRQQFIVMNRPQRLRDNCWLVIAKIQENDYDSVLAPGTGVGSSTRFVTNYQPELHSEGYTKYQSNVEKHRTYIATHRVDVDMSAMYKPMEDVFIQIGKGEKDDPVYKLNTAEQTALENFMEVRNQHLLWGKTNMDENGKPKIYDEIGRPLVSGDGLIAQVERFAEKFVFARLNTKLFQKALNAMIQKSEKALGNKYIFVVNTLMWQEIQDTLGAWIRDYKTDGIFLYSKASNGYVKLGATYDSYEVAGNEVAFKLDRSLDVEFPTRRIGIMIDLTADAKSGKPAMAQYTFKGGEFIHNYINGVGGRSGLESGEVSSPVAGGKIINWGFSGIAVFNPYRSVILMSNEVRNDLF